MVHLGCIFYKKDGNGQEYLVEISLHVITLPAGGGGVQAQRSSYIYTTIPSFEAFLTAC